jgi:hypothetical protein
MISREYGGPSKIGNSQQLSVSASSADWFELVELVGVSLTPATFVVKANVTTYLKQGATSAAVIAGFSADDFELDTNVYWRIDVDLASERFLGFLGVTSDGFIKITRISSVL